MNLQAKLPKFRYALAFPALTKRFLATVKGLIGAFTIRIPKFLCHGNHDRRRFVHGTIHLVGGVGEVSSGDSIAPDRGGAGGAVRRAHGLRHHPGEWGDAEGPVELVGK